MILYFAPFLYKYSIISLYLDRGQYATEIIRFMIGMMNENNTKDKLTVILNRGNHEPVDMYMSTSAGSFQSELTKKGLKNILDPFKIFINQLPSAIILECDREKYWLSHGGFFVDRKSKTPFFRYNITKPNVIFYRPASTQIPLQIRWNDFISYEKHIPNQRGEGILNITPNEVRDFCQFNNIKYESVFIYK